MCHIGTRATNMVSALISTNGTPPGGCLIKINRSSGHPWKYAFVMSPDLTVRRSHETHMKGECSTLRCHRLESPFSHQWFPPDPESVQAAITKYPQHLRRLVSLPPDHHHIQLVELFQQVFISTQHASVQSDLQ